MKVTLALLSIVGLGITGTLWFLGKGDVTSSTFRTAPVTRRGPGRGHFGQRHGRT